MGIDDVIARYIELTRAPTPIGCRGDHWRADCPFCADGGGASLLVCGFDHGFVCERCGAAGDAFSFLMAIERCGFKDALGRLAAMVSERGLL